MNCSSTINNNIVDNRNTKNDVNERFANIINGNHSKGNIVSDLNHNINNNSNYC